VIAETTEPFWRTPDQMGHWIETVKPWNELKYKFLKSYSDNTIFVHERVARGAGGGGGGTGQGGQRRLVALAHGAVGTTVAGGTQIAMALLATVVDQGTLVRYPKVVMVWPMHPHMAWGEGVTRIFAGQPDPLDASHFTFDYEKQGRRYTMDGWLEADDTVTLQARDATVVSQGGTTLP
jgi:hypothetical protein